MRLPLPLHKMFLILSVFAVALVTFSGLGVAGVVTGFLVGTAVSAVILAIRQRKDVASAVIVATGGLVGAFFSQFFTRLGLLHGLTLADLAWNGAVLAVGTVVGGLFFSWASKR